LRDDLLLARHAALAGAEVALRYFTALADLPQEFKSDGSVVTAADRAVEAAIRAVLAEERPGDAILGEEGGQTGGQHNEAGRRWLVDPIDGTALFVAEDDRWLVLVALEEDGEIMVGVAAVPAQQRIWWAQRGTGAFEARMTGQKLSHERTISVDTDGSKPPSRSRLAVLPSLDALSPAERDRINPLIAVTPPTSWHLHPALLVATGDLDLAVQMRGQVWDYGATSLIVAEAGGRFGGLDGEPLKLGGSALFARTAGLHAATLRILRSG
jgi:histidinol-phosphatase